MRFNVEQWAEWVGARDDTYHLGTSKQEVLATVEALADELADRAVPIDIERPDDWPVSWPEEFDRSTLDSSLAQATGPRPAWDVTAELIVELREAAAENTPLSDDATAAAGTVLSDEGIPRGDEGVYDTVTCEADWPTDLTTYYEDMRWYREIYPFRDGNGSGVIGAAPTPCTFRSFTPPEPLVPLERDGYPTGVVIQARRRPRHAVRGRAGDGRRARTTSWSPSATAARTGTTAATSA